MNKRLRRVVRLSRLIAHMTLGAALVGLVYPLA
jgi:hypothetical protein